MLYDPAHPKGTGWNSITFEDTVSLISVHLANVKHMSR